MKIDEAAKTGLPLRRSGWSDWLTEQTCAGTMGGDSVQALCFPDRVNPHLDFEDLTADDWEVQHKPMNLIEAVQSGKPFKRSGWVEFMDFAKKSPAQAQGFYREDLLATDYILEDS